MQTGVAAQVAVPVKKTRVIVTVTVTVIVDWFVGLIIVRLVFLIQHTIVVRSHQVCLYTYETNYLVTNLWHNAGFEINTANFYPQITYSLSFSFVSYTHENV